MAALLKHAIRPNLVQTLEGNPAFIHGGPFANIAHGCSSVIATRAALALSDIVITEAGFGADLGAEKFIDIKCRKARLEPAAAVIVATVRALKYHGGVDLGNLADDNPEALLKGLANLERHVINLTQQFGLPVVVALNHFTTDRESEIERIRTRLLEMGVEVILARHWAEGGTGAVDLANALLRLLALPERPVRFLYPDDATLLEKLAAVATRTYGAQDIAVTDKVAAEVKSLEAAGFGGLPICVAKTPYSFSTDPSLRGAPSGHILTVRDVRLSAGAGFVVFICGDIMTMPGLPRIPAASSIDIDAEGNISGLF
jgi:formate--tetrahydrofolate ligase